MPILIDPPAADVLDSAVVDLNTLTFNTDPFLKVHTLDGWWDTPGYDVKLMSGGARGAVPTGLWLEKERYLTVAGHTVGIDPVAMRRALIAAFPQGVDSPVTLTYRDGTKETLWVRPYDRFDMEIKGNQLRFILPLVALDPLKYRAQPLTGNVGAASGTTWYRNYALSGARWVRTYALSGTRWVRAYVQAEPPGDYPPTLVLNSDGDVSSNRVVITVTGPLLAGEWWLTNDTTGERLWAEVGVDAGQSLVFDSQARTAHLNGADVGHLVFGDWLTLEPGGNTFRLVSGTASDAYAHIEASEALQ